MKHLQFALLTLFLLSLLSVQAQQNHFIYIQTENKQPFYVKLDNKVYNSSAAGYLLVPKLKDGAYKLAIGFPKGEWTEQNMVCTIDKNDIGYLLKNFGSKGWGLFNLQSLDVVMAAEKEKVNNVEVVNNEDAFSNMLSSVVNDSTIRQTETVKEEVKPVPGKEAETTSPVASKTNETELNKVAAETPKDELKIDYLYDDANGKARVIIEQTQKTDKVFRLPITIDIYNGANKVSNKVWVENSIDTFTFAYTRHPDLINVDADRVLLCEKTDNKTAANFIHQFKFAPNYLDRKEALDYFSAKGLKELSMGLTDKFAGLRSHTIEGLFDSKFSKDTAVIKSIETIANHDKNKKTKSVALSFLAAMQDIKYRALFDKCVNDSSYSVAGAALAGLIGLDPANAYELSKKYASDAKGILADVVINSLIAEGRETDFDLIADIYREAPFSQEKIGMSLGIINYLLKVNDLDKIKEGIKDVMVIRKNIPVQYRTLTDNAFKKSFEKLSKAKGAEVEEYIKLLFK